MKPKKKRIALIIILGLLIVLGAGAGWQWNNIMAVMLYYRYSKTELSNQIAAENSRSGGTLSKLPVSVTPTPDAKQIPVSTAELPAAEKVRTSPESPADLAPKASEKAKANDIGGEEVAAAVPPDNKPTALKPAAAVAQNGEEDQREASPSPSASPPVSESADEQRINALVSQLYTLQDSFTSRIDNLMQQAKTDYLALPKEEQNSASKQRILLKYIGQASALEGSCDAQVNAIVSELRELLIKTGSNLSLVDEIKSTYNQEKSLKKAYYIGQMSKY